MEEKEDNVWASNTTQSRLLQQQQQTFQNSFFDNNDNNSRNMNMNSISNHGNMYNSGNNGNTGMHRNILNTHSINSNNNFTFQNSSNDNHQAAAVQLPIQMPVVSTPAPVAPMTMLIMSMQQQQQQQQQNAPTARSITNHHMAPRGINFFSSLANSNNNNNDFVDNPFEPTPLRMDKVIPVPSLPLSSPSSNNSYNFLPAQMSATLATNIYNDNSTRGYNSSSTSGTMYNHSHYNNGNTAATTSEGPTSYLFNKNKRLLPAGYQPTDRTVICANKRKYFESKGNVRFRLVCNLHLKEYTAAPTKIEKSNVVSKVLKIFRDECPDHGDAAFVSPASKSSLDGGVMRWYAVAERTAREKVGTYFRDCLADKYQSSAKNKIAKRKLVKRDSSPGENSSTTTSSLCAGGCGGIAKPQSISSSNLTVAPQQHFFPNTTTATTITNAAAEAAASAAFYAAARFPNARESLAVSAPATQSTVTLTAAASANLLLSAPPPTKNANGATNNNHNGDDDDDENSLDDSLGSHMSFYDVDDLTQVPI